MHHSFRKDEDYCELQFMERVPEFTRGTLFICCNSLECKMRARKCEAFSSLATCICSNPTPENSRLPGVFFLKKSVWFPPSEWSECKSCKGGFRCLKNQKRSHLFQSKSLFRSEIIRFRYGMMNKWRWWKEISNAYRQKNTKLPMCVDITPVLSYTKYRQNLWKLPICVT